MKRMKLLFTLALPVLALQNIYAQGSRLVSKANWHNNGAVFVPTDTTTYNYLTENGGDLKHPIKDNYDTTWVSNGATFVNSVSSIQNLVGSNVSDHTWLSWDTGSNSWKNNSKSIYTYDASNNLINTINQVWNGSTWAPVSQEQYSYNSANEVIFYTYSLWNSTSNMFVLSNQKSYAYVGGMGAIMQETDQANVGGTITNTAQYNYSYDTGLLSTTTYSVWNGTNWANNYKYTYSYDASHNRITSLYQTYNSSTSTWTNDTLKNYTTFASYSAGAAMLPSLETDQVWDTTGGGSWKNSIQYMYSYNGSSQMTSMVGTSWNIAGLWENANGDPAANYHYSPFSEAVNDVKNAAGQAFVFPIPAQGVLNINLTWKEAQSCTISLIDMSGRVVKQTGTPVAAQYNAVMPIENVPDGNYLVKINGTNGQIVKQVVVAH